MAYPMNVASGSMKASEVYSPTSTGQDFFGDATKISLLAAWIRGSPIGRFAHQQAHFGMRRLKPGVNVEFFEGFGCRGADRPDAAAPQRRQRGLFDALL